jgi:hypothetical protein
VSQDGFQQRVLVLVLVGSALTLGAAAAGGLWWSSQIEAEPLRVALSQDEVAEAVAAPAGDTGAQSKAEPGAPGTTPDPGDHADPRVVPTEPDARPLAVPADGDPPIADGPVVAEAAAAPQPTDPGVAAAPKRKPRDCGDRRVKRRKDGTYVMKKSVLDGYATHPARADSLGSFGFSHNKTGKTTGLRFGKLPCPGLLRAAGFRPNDRVVTINGRPPTSVARAVAIWADARRGGKATVVIRHPKRGKRVQRYVFTN